MVIIGADDIVDLYEGGCEMMKVGNVDMIVIVNNYNRVERII